MSGGHRRLRRNEGVTVDKLTVAAFSALLDLSQSDRYSSRYGPNELEVEISVGGQPDGGGRRL